MNEKASKWLQESQTNSSRDMFTTCWCHMMQRPIPGILVGERLTARKNWPGSQRESGFSAHRSKNPLRIGGSNEQITYALDWESQLSLSMLSEGKSPNFGQIRQQQFSKYSFDLKGGADRRYGRLMQNFSS